MKEVSSREKWALSQVEPPYYLASCDGCGWIGSSHDCTVDSDPLSDTDLYCPRCGDAGCDHGHRATEILASLEAGT